MLVCLCIFEWKNRMATRAEHIPNGSTIFARVSLCDDEYWNCAIRWILNFAHFSVHAKAPTRFVVARIQYVIYYTHWTHQIQNIQIGFSTTCAVHTYACMYHVPCRLPYRTHICVTCMRFVCTQTHTATSNTSTTHTATTRMGDFFLLLFIKAHKTTFSALAFSHAHSLIHSLSLWHKAKQNKNGDLTVSLRQITHYTQCIRT